MVEEEETALEGEDNTAVEFLTLEKDIFKQKSQLCQYYVHDLQKREANKDEKQRIQDDTKELTEKNNIPEEMEKKNQDLKNMEKKQGKLTKYIEGQKEKFTQLDLQDVDVREKLKHIKSS